MGGECAPDIALPPVARKPHLLAGIALAPDQMRINLQPRQPRQLARQQHRLVVTAAAQPAGMQRHRNQQRTGGPEVASHRRHEPGAKARQFGPVAIFEGTHQRAGHLAIAHGGPGPRKGGRFGKGFGRKRIGAVVHRKGYAEHRAVWLRYLGQARKAGGAQAIAQGQRRLADNAAGRIKLVEHHPAQPGQSPDQPDARPYGFDFVCPQPHKSHIAPCPVTAKAPSMTTAPRLFDDVHIARNLARRAGTDNFVRDLVLEDLADRLSAYKRQFRQAVLIGPDASSLPQTLFTADGAVTVERVEAFSGEEFPALPEGEKDLIISLLHLQAVNDVPGHLARLRRMLKPDGLLLAAFVGGDSLTELREAFLAADLQVTGGASARVAPMAQVRDAGALLQRAGFALPVADVETHRVRYGTPFALMAELKALGASNPLSDRPRRFATRTLLAAAAQAYAERDADPDGRVRATLEIIWLAGWVPHESQQKPLRPGSATVSMKDVLGGRT